MPGVRVRKATADDAAAVVRLGRAIDSDQLATESSLRRLLVQSPAASTERLVAEIDGRVIASGTLRRVRRGRRLVLDRRYRLYAEGRTDTPSATARPSWTFDEWRAQTIDSPLIDLDASVVVFENDEPVALAWLYSDREGRRAEALMAATRRDRRGRGLATLAKIESAQRAAQLGTRILTSNDLDDAPMLAINRKLGFAETAVVESFTKSL